MFRLFFTYILPLILPALALTGDYGKPGSEYVPPRFEGGKIVPGERRQ